MININLAIDEKRMSLPPGSKVSIGERLALFSDLLGKTRKDGCQLWLRKALYEVQIEHGVFFFDLLFNQNKVSIDPDIRRLLQLRLNLCNDLDRLPNVQNTTKEQVETWRSMGQAAACLVLDDPVGNDPATVESEADLFRFYRDVPELVKCSEEDYIIHAERSFPKIAFKPGIAKEFKHFSECYTNIHPKMSRVLAVLNDRLEHIRNECHQDNRRIQKSLSSEAKFEVSLESPNTHKNEKAMKEREAVFNGKSVRCEWHVKFQPHTDRMHFNSGKASIADGKILICHFTQHLST